VEFARVCSGRESRVILGRGEEVAVIFAFTDGDVWRPGIGDPTVMGWITVVAYFAAALLCFRQTIAKGTSASREKKVFWSTLTILLVFLGFNKQLDLQTLLTLTGRRIALAQGWYGKRRVIQFIFVVVIAIGGLLSVVVMGTFVRRHPELRLALVGLITLLVFVVVRAASFHHVDQVINLHVGGVKMNVVLELGAIALVSLGAWKAGTDRDNTGGDISPPEMAAAHD
jgi:hypothetical protein